MQIVDSLKECSSFGKVVLTMGNYDGIHLGHQQILQRVLQIAKREGAKSAVLTFSNHPSEVLRPQQPHSLLMALDEKSRLIEELGIDLLITLPFTKAFSEQTPEQFLQNLQRHLAFSHLILGFNALFGKDRMGDQQRVSSLATQLVFEVEYLPPFSLEGHPVSSRRIRQELRQGHLDKVRHYLGRPYSISGTVIPGKGLGSQLGFPTANIAVNRRCLPPYGVYTVSVCYNNHHHQGIANLGLAPTARKDSTPLLEVHLFHFSEKPLQGKTLDVIFGTFIRPEITFPNLDSLKLQIQKDIVNAKKL